MLGLSEISRHIQYVNEDLPSPPFAPSAVCVRGNGLVQRLTSLLKTCASILGVI